MKQQFSGTCDWCGNQRTDLVEHQDFEEGLAGQTWDVCAECRRKENEAINRELEGEQ